MKNILLESLLKINLFLLINVIISFSVFSQTYEISGSQNINYNFSYDANGNYKLTGNYKINGYYDLGNGISGNIELSDNISLSGHVNLPSETIEFLNTDFETAVNSATEEYKYKKSDNDNKSFYDSVDNFDRNKASIKKPELAPISNNLRFYEIPDETSKKHKFSLKRIFKNK